MFLVIFCASCSSSLSNKNETFDPFSYKVDSARLLDGEAWLGEFIAAKTLPPEELMAVSPEIRAYLSQLPKGASPEEKWSLLVAQFRAGLFEVQYDIFTTLPVADTFRRRKGNCLSVTMLLVAMARELGINASFNQVLVPPTRLAEAEVMVNFRHINLAVDLAGGRQVIDFGVVEFDVAFANQLVSDRVALSQFYNNVAAERLLAGDHSAAFANLRKALELAPGNSDFWVNLGVLYEKENLGSLAEESFIQALQLNPLNMVAARNLERVLRKQDRGTFVEGLVASVQERRREDPLFIYFQARQAYQTGRYTEARRLLERGVRKEGKSHRLYFLLGITSFRLRDFASSKEHLRHAFALVRDPQVKRDYERQLFELQQIQL